MSATTAPTVTLNVTESAATEIKKFMSSEEGLPETSGLRVRVVPGGCSGFQYSLNIEEQSREGDFVMTVVALDCLENIPTTPGALVDCRLITGLPSIPRRVAANYCAFEF